MLPRALCCSFYKADVGAQLSFAYNFLAHSAWRGAGDQTDMQRREANILGEPFFFLQVT